MDIVIWKWRKFIEGRQKKKKIQSINKYKYQLVYMYKKKLFILIRPIVSYNQKISQKKIKMLKINNLI